MYWRIQHIKDDKYTISLITDTQPDEKDKWMLAARWKDDQAIVVCEKESTQLFTWTVKEIINGSGDYWIALADE